MALFGLFWRFFGGREIVGKCEDGLDRGALAARAGATGRRAPKSLREGTSVARLGCHPAGMGGWHQSGTATDSWHFEIGAARRPDGAGSIWCSVIDFR